MQVSEQQQITSKKLRKASVVHPAFYFEFWRGACRAYQGAKAALQNRVVRTSYFSLVKQLLLAIIITNILIILCFIPINIILYVISYFSDMSSIQYYFSPITIFNKLSLFVPVVGVGVYRFLIPSYWEKMFNAGMDDIAPELSLTLKARESKLPSLKSLFSGYVSRMAILSLIGITIFVLSKLPLVGIFVIPLAEFWYTQRTLDMKSAALISLLSLLPTFRPYSTKYLQVLMSSAALGRELLDLYYRHLTVEEIKYIKSHYYGLIVGFSLPFNLLMSIPFIGLPFWGIAQASVAALIVAILEQNRKENGNRLFGDNLCDTSRILSDQGLDPINILITEEKEA